MNIYIDEAGIFVKPNENKCAISTVGALILPENKTKIIFSKFEGLKNKWGFKGKEVKEVNLMNLRYLVLLKYLKIIM